MTRKAFLASSLSCLTLAMMLAPKASAAAFAQGDLVVVTVGDGVTALSGNAAQVAVKEFNSTTAGQASAIQTFALPTVASGSSGALTISGSAGSEGFLSLSTDNQFLIMTGYNAAPGTAGVATATPAAVNRVVGRISMTGALDTTTTMTDAYSGSNIRSAASTDGTSLWTAGNGGSGQGATAGVRSTSLGATSGSAQLNSTTSNNRVVKIFNNQLYVSAASGTFLGISTVGTGIPTTAGSGALTLLPGMPTSGTHSSYDFWFKDTSTLYVADDGTAATGGGIQKWILNAGTWTLSYTLLNNGTTTTGVRSLVGTVDGNGDAELFATTASTSANNLIAVTDTGAASTATVLATAAASTGFRGVEFIPIVPEPSTMALLGLGAAGLFMIRRRK